MRTRRYETKLFEFFTEFVDEIRALRMSKVLSPRRGIGVGKGRSTRFPEYTAGVDQEGTAFGKKKLGAKYEEGTFLDNEWGFCYLGEI